MNFLGRPSHLSGYRQVHTFGGAVENPLIYAKKTGTRTRERRYWKWRKGSRVSTINDWLQIKIGGDEEVNRKKTHKQQNRIKSTKYTLISFLPQNLLEQFQRIANFYFLVMSIISLLIDSPVSPMTSILPLVFVISITAAKQGYEDFLRYRTDNIVNFSPVTIIRNGEEINVLSQDVAPGDLVIVERDCDVPCDLVILRSSDPHSKCFITTANLDGESNLKTLQVPRDLPSVTISRLPKLGVIECESPSNDLYSFNGKIVLSGAESRVLPLTAENVLLRGSRVKNTECIIGCAIYTGMTTKLQLNSRLTRNKSASSEIYINRFLLFILSTLIGIVSLLYFLKRYMEIAAIPKMGYLGPPADSYSVKQFLQDYLSFLILFNYLIPISLYVTIEMHRVFGGFFMEWDIELFDQATDNHCIVNTSNLNEDLGQINILFSDKTGTLTKNEMIFQQCSINGRKFIYRKTRLQEDDTGTMFDINKFNDDQRNFFQGLAICHTVQVAGDLNRASPTSEVKSKIREEEENMVSNKGCSETYSISDITEETCNNSQQIDGNVEQTLGITETSLTSDIGAKSLLSGDKIQHRKRTQRPQIVKRSPNFTRNRSRVYPSVGENGNNIELLNGNPFPSSLQNLPGDRPISLPFKRSTSEMDLPEFVNKIKNGHQRSQSYGTPGSYMNPNSVSFGGNTGLIFRTSSTASRESYAAPNFRRQPTLLVRAESQRRKNEVENVVQMLDYQASSPDEKALVEACAFLGMVYLGDDDEILRIRVVPPHLDHLRPFSIGKINEIFYERLHILEFTSDRKRMSVIIKDRDGTKWIYTKGAESYVFPLCSASSLDLVTKTNEHINEFAKQGLRTLAVARRRLTEEDYRQFLEGVNSANSSLENRKELREQCYAEIERNLDLLGATAVEDALQDDVADTLISLQRAGIKIWVLTGDKIETALNIALACGHIPPTAIKYFITECTRREDLLVHLNALEREIIFALDHPCALLIDGKSLATALSEVPKEFGDVTIKCTAVLCCRLSPLQKSEVVSLIKNCEKDYITAAIGDGANDVSMIQEAHVGIGIMGKEGRQAARCADFAFARFSMLKRLLLVHGHYHATRLALLVLFFFYKNSLFMGVMFLFQFHTLFSSSSVYDSLFLTLFNPIYTSLPIFLISITEKTHREETLLRKPELYKKNTNNRLLQWSFFFSWILYGIYHTLICFYFAFFMFSTNNILLNSGQAAEFACFGTLLIQMVVIVSNLKIWLESKYLTYWYMGTIVGSIMVFVITTVIYNVNDIRYDADIYFAYNKLLSSIPVWLFTILTTVACLLPDFILGPALHSITRPKLRLFRFDRQHFKVLRRRKKVESTHL